MPEELFKRSFTILSRNFDKAGENSTEIKAILKGLNFDSEIIRRTVVVAFEAEMNVVMYARSGTLTFMITEEDIQIEIEDEGPGIPDIELAMKDGYSTSKGLGLGLPGCRRIMDEFEIRSAKGRGTTVTIRKWKR